MAAPTPPEPSRAEAELSDRSLLARLRQGESDAATELYLRYAKRLHALAVAQTAPDLAARVDPDDIVQSVFRTFFRRASHGQYDVPEAEELWKLFLVMALNKIRSTAAYHRAAKRNVSATAGGGLLDQAAQHVAGQDEMALTTLRLVVSELLEGLPESQRRMVELRIEGHELAEIAAQTQRSRRSVG